jgi:type II secretory pathway predicted ATPase ExeA
MYTEFYNLKEKPFDLTPSPRFLYLGEAHKEALALLTYGVMERKGFVLLTGEVGTGKTTTIRALLKDLDVTVRCVHLANPVLTPRDFISYLAICAFGSRVHFKSKAEFLFQLEALLKERVRQQKYFVLILDEAHKLSFEVLEEIRLLSNLETDDEKLISIFLVGQPELNEKLSTPECRPLLQRISIRYHIRPLKLEETEGYVSTRLKVAGAQKVEEIFPKKVIKALQEYSGGYPRMINILGDNVLLLGFSRGERRITPGMVRDCYEELRLDTATPKGEQAASKGKEKGEERIRPFSRWKWVIGLLFLLIIGGLAGIPQGRQILVRAGERISKTSGALFKAAIEQLIGPSKEKGGSPMRKDRADKELKDKHPLSAQGKRGEAIGGSPIEESAEELKSGTRARTGPGVSVTPAHPQMEASVNIPPEKEQLSEASRSDIEGATKQAKMDLGDEEREIFRSVVVKRGDTFLGLVAETYGFIDDSVVNMVHASNPQIRDINVIAAGQRIVFPPLSKPSVEPAYTIHVGSFRDFSAAQDLFQKLKNSGYEAFIFPLLSPMDGKAFRVTVGALDSRKEADELVRAMMSEGIVRKGEIIKLDMR